MFENWTIGKKVFLFIIFILNFYIISMDIYRLNQSQICQYNPFVILIQIICLFIIPMCVLIYILNKFKEWYKWLFISIFFSWLIYKIMGYIILNIEHALLCQEGTSYDKYKVLRILATQPTGNLDNQGAREKYVEKLSDKLKKRVLVGDNISAENVVLEAIQGNDRAGIIKVISGYIGDDGEVLCPQDTSKVVGCEPVKEP